MALARASNVFADLGFDKAEAENLKLRAELMMRIEDRPEGKIGLFSLDALVNIANRTGSTFGLSFARQPELALT